MVVAVGLALGCAVVALVVAAPRYTATATFFVSTPGQGVNESYQGGLFAQQRVSSYAQMLRDGGLARGIAEEEGVGLTAAQVRERIAIHPVANTVLLRATVTDTDRARCQRIAQALAERVVSVVEGLETPPGASASVVTVTAIGEAALEPVATSPDPVRYGGLAAASGLLLGLVLVLLRDRWDVAVRTVGGVEAVSGGRVLAVVPSHPGMRRAVTVPEATVGDTAGPDVARLTARLEAFQGLGASLRDPGLNRPAKVFVITSAARGEGRSTTAAGLATALARAGRRVVVVDADLRRPRLAAYLGVDSSCGLSDVLAGRAEAPDVWQRRGTRELYVLPAGPVPSNPADLLRSARMARLVGQLRDEFDAVVVDTPPALSCADAAAVASLADGAVVVVRAGRTRRHELAGVVARLRSVGAPLLGCVFNRTSAAYAYRGHGEGGTPPVAAVLADGPAR